MKIVVSEIPDEGREVELTESCLSDSLKLSSPLRAFLRFEKKEAEVIVSGVIDAHLQTLCSKCLKEFTLHMSSDVNVVYHPDHEIRRDDAHELKGDELDTGFYNNDLLNTNDIVTEQLLLALPMRTLCSEQCMGLCPHCGADLNVEPCSCEQKETDPRLQLLKQLLPKRKE